MFRKSSFLEYFEAQQKKLIEATGNEREIIYAKIGRAFSEYAATFSKES